MSDLEGWCICDPLWEPYNKPDPACRHDALEELLEQRDTARRIAVSLEQELAEANRAMEAMYRAVPQRYAVGVDFDPDLIPEADFGRLTILPDPDVPRLRRGSFGACAGMVGRRGRMTTPKACGSLSATGQVRCQLPAGHDGWCQWQSPGAGIVKWNRGKK